MEKSEAFEQIIKGYSPDIQELVRATRQLILSMLPKAVEVVWNTQKIAGYGTGGKKKTEHFSWVMLAKNHVTLGFNYGPELPDPENILEGSGKLYRHFKVRSMEDLNKPDLITILKFSTSYRVSPLNSY
ncbi:DUF1801 domain-containing protein [Flavobacteriaceae bacterium KMM 6898]|nr:DUF1801 domain-containing protein [Flavobacteriaceae bacterium KMM 6898]